MINIKTQFIQHHHLFSRRAVAGAFAILSACYGSVIAAAQPFASAYHPVMPECHTAASGFRPMSLTPQSDVALGRTDSADSRQDYPEMLQVKELTLSNGLTVWINEDHTQPKAYGAVVVKAGARDCPDTGIAHYFEHILFKGTDNIGTVDYERERPWLDSIADCYDRLAQTTDTAERHSIQKDINRLSIEAARYAIPNEFNNLISRYGGTGLNAYTSLDETVFYNTFSPQYIAQWAELNSERMLNPVFRLFQGELETVYEEKNMYSDNMAMPAVEALQRRVFAGTPYEYPIVGSTANLKNPRLSEMRDFFDRYYVAGNMGLVLCGDICSDTIVPLLERTFGRLRRGEAPARVPIVQKPFGSDDRLNVKLPLPIIKVQGRLFRAPANTHPDHVPLELAMSLLSNGSGTGLLDSLEHAHKVMGVIAGMLGLSGGDDLVGYGYIPRIPFGSKKKAARLSREQVDRLMAGNFDDAVFNALKTEELRKAKEDLENMNVRASMMVNAFSRGRRWADVLSRPQLVQAVTRDDIMRVARKYLDAGSFLVTKKFGFYGKDKLTQPGYTPVKPEHAGGRSAYAQRLDSMPMPEVAPRFISLDSDVAVTPLRPLVTLYTVDNPVNDLFSLELIYHRGTIDDNRLDAVASYIGQLGTDSLAPRQFGLALQRIGAELTMYSGNETFRISLKGFDRSFAEAVRLLGSLMTNAKADDEKFRDLVAEELVGEKFVFRENTAIAQAVFERVAYGDRSEFINRLTAAQLKQMKGSELIDIFRDLQHTELSVVYSGTLAQTDVERTVRNSLPLDLVSRPYDDTPRRLLSYDEPTVYLYDNPSARQTVIGTYNLLAPQPSAAARTRFNLWSRYFGSGMSSLLFQDIREFRSLAYYAGGDIRQPSLVRYPDRPVAYETMLGTQADKAMQALAVLDTLFTDMPMRENNVTAVKQIMTNSVNNNRPAFRKLGSRVAMLRVAGYDDDPSRATMAALEPLGAADVEAFYREYVRPSTRVTIVVGDRRKLDMAALSRYGKVVELKKADVFRTGK